MNKLENITQKFKDMGDLAAVNAARVSFNKWKNEFDTADAKLIEYLLNHSHWTPFAHSQLAFIRSNTPHYYADWVTNAGPGFRRVLLHHGESVTWIERGSLYAYLRNFGHFEPDIAYQLVNRYPVTVGTFTGRQFNLREGTSDNVVDITDALYSEDTLNTALMNRGIATDYSVLARIGVAHLFINQPIAIAREWYRHTYDLARNEVSRRYVDTEPDMFTPTYLRKRSPSAKQGSLGDPIDNHEEVMGHYQTNMEYAVGTYLGLLEEGVAPEVARFTLPQAMYTTFIETGSIDAYLRIYTLRSAADAQMEIRDYAHKLRATLEESWPLIWEEAGSGWNPEHATYIEQEYTT